MHGVAQLARLEAADLVRAVERPRAVDRRADQRPPRTSCACRSSASVIANGIDGEKPPPGLTSVASATGTDASISARAGANRPSFEIEGGARQQRRRDAGACHRRDAVGRHEDEVIGRSRADVGGHPRAAARPELVGVDARLASRRAARPRMRGDSSGVKTPVSQKTSHHSASSAAATAGNHVVDDEVDVSVAIAAILDSGSRARP